VLYALTNDGEFVALKRAAEDREGWRHRERMSKTCCTQKTTDDDDDMLCTKCRRVWAETVNCTNCKLLVE